MEMLPKILRAATTIIFTMIIVITACKKEETSNDIKDGDGNIYTTVKIGTQNWLKENLKTTKYNDGTSIPLVTLSSDWKSLTTPAYCYYDNDAANKDIYGALYNWYAVNTGKLCPKGFHVPTQDEWRSLRSFLGTDPGGKMKSTTLWNAPNTGATNSSGFTALPGGRRTDSDDALFINKGTMGHFWSSTQTGPANADDFYLEDVATTLNSYDYSKTLGASCRCLED
jgi:uncharacterized protein (TIGR02145 family)